MSEWSRLNWNADIQKDFAQKALFAMLLFIGFFCSGTFSVIHLFYGNMTYYARTTHV